MARKSNKTAHVLGLITKNQGDDNSDNAVEEGSEQSVETPVATALEEPAVEKNVIEIPMAEDNPVSLEIKNNLMEFLNNELATDGEDSADDSQAPSHNVSHGDLTPQDLTANNAESETLATHEEALEEPIDEPPVFSNMSFSSLHSQPNISANGSYPPAPLGFHYLNVLEFFVQEQVDIYMKRFEVCCCPRCRADVAAITLSSLTPKYIVADGDDYFPLLNFYRNKFAVSITAQLIKACMRVKESPRHKLDQ